MKQNQFNNKRRIHIASYLLLFSLSLVSLTLKGQKKVDLALNQLLKSEFMIKYKEMKTEVEATAKHFKSIQHQYSFSEVAAVRKSYNKTIFQFNQVLEDIKIDLLDRKKMRSISKIPEDYAKSLELDMYQLANNHTAKFYQVVSDVTQDEVDGSGILVLLAEIFGLTKTIVTEITQMVQASKEYSETYLNQNLMKPYQIPEWKDIGEEDEDDYSDEDDQQPTEGDEEEYQDYHKKQKKGLDQ